ncbi:MAG: aldehyde ferredoxin oxidoreductase family protein [Methanosarcinaceae archaeon]|nr:aldehyde ferredoxin oxidoreductase family protein [Methanosarcinaceae archaeon]
MFGWTGRMITVDLSNRSIFESKTDVKTAKEYLGGRGMGVKILSDMVTPTIDPLGPENPLILTTGPLTGTPAPMSGRHSITTRSPLTGTIFDSSAGGFFGKEMKFAGIDALIITGKADEPVYLRIDNEDVDILSAAHLWGMNTRETTKMLQSKGRVSCIGKAGERQVMIANIMNDYVHACGRGGLGAVAGSKNLKAIVVRGDNKPEIADEVAFTKAKESAMRLLRASPVTSKGLKNYGTSVLVNLMNYIKILPTDNFRSREFKGADSVSGEYINDNYDITRHSCYNCPVGCKRSIKEDEMEIPEYETVWAFGPDIGNEDMDSIIRANRLCNDYGMDTISCGSTIAAYSELTSTDIDPAKLDEFVIQIGEGESELGAGSLAYLRSKGAEELSMSSKGLEFPGYDPRGVLGQALGYATSNRGGCHLRAYMVAPEVIGKPKLIDRLTFSGKAGLVQIFQNLAAAIDSLAVCKFESFAMGEEELAALLSAVTGVHYSPQDLLRAGERIWNLERLFNIGAGFTRADDSLPGRMFESGEFGIKKDEFERTLTEYYYYRGWNEDGIPSSEKLKELGIS